MWAQLDFFPSNIHNLVFSGKKQNQIPKILSTWVFVAQISLKVWHFPAGMETLNKMSQMPNSCPHNSIPPIFYGNNYFDMHLIVIKL